MSYVRSLIRRLALRLLRVNATWSESYIDKLESGGVIVCSNHVSLLDGIIVALASPTPLVFGVDTDFSRKSKFAIRGMAVLGALGSHKLIPIDSSAPFGIRALRRALELGESVMIFPEGRISETGLPLAEKPGLNWLKEKTNATVIKIQIRGPEQSRLFAKAGRTLWPRIHITF